MPFIDEKKINGEKGKKRKRTRRRNLLFYKCRDELKLRSDLPCLIFPVPAIYDLFFFAMFPTSQKSQHTMSV
jgi:hypothetical protein